MSSRPNLPVLVLALLGLLALLFTFQEIGASWDEPLFYRYADEISGAYDVRALQNGTYDLEEAYSLTDHRYYGPAYLLLARPLVNLLDAVHFPGQRIDHWHLLNALTFLAGGLGLYGLARRWAPAWAAFFAALLYLSQPVLWGHGFINPKDIPFLTLFILTMHTGLNMADGLTGPVPAFSSSPAAGEPGPAWLRARRRLLPLGTAALGLALAFLLLGPPLADALAGLVRAAYSAPGGSTLGRLFASVASQGGQVPVDAYVAKLLVWARRFWAAGLVLSVPLAAAMLLERARPHSLPRGWDGLRAGLARWLTLPEARLTRAEIRPLLRAVLPAALMLGLLSAVRVVGPLAGLLVTGAFLLRRGRRSWAGLLLYAAMALIVMVIFWPYLWQAPAARLVEVLGHMASNPVSVAVQYAGQIISSGELPAGYLPTMLLLTLTLPVLPLAAVGLISLAARARRDPPLAGTAALSASLAVLIWLFLPLAYLLIASPPLYDGYRHFLFILPPLFLLAGRGLASLAALAWPLWQGRPWSARLGKAVLAALAAALLAPGLLGAARMLPYPYTYFNQLAGGVQGAFRRYDTDYWLTCYKHVIEEQVNPLAAPGARLYALREPRIAALYARPDISVERYRQGDSLPSGSLLLLTTRMNADQVIFPDAPVLYREGWGQALFCVVKKMP